MAEPETESAAHPFAGDPVFDLHVGGKLETVSTVALTGRDELSMAYTPGVARVCLAIAEDPTLTQHYTWVPNVVAVVTDGTAVLGLGDIGPAAAMPVMEGKAVLFKQFGGVDAVPICLATTDTEEIIETVARLAPSFGGINLEDISAPRCFEIEDRLKAMLDIPVFHDDQHGTAVVALAALTNALRLTGPRPRHHPRGDLRSRCRRRRGGQDPARRGRPRPRRHRPPGRAQLAAYRPHAGQGRARPDDRRHLRPATARSPRCSSGADVYIGVSGGTVPEEVVASMAPESVIFGLANPDPEVHPDVANRHARVVATGRSDFPNQINNVLAFPGIFRGAFDVHATRDHRGHEARRRRGAGRPRRRRPRRGPHRPVAVRPARRSRRLLRRRRGRAPRRVARR